MPERQQDHRGIALAVPFDLRGLDESLNLGLLRYSRVRNSAFGTRFGGTVPITVLRGDRVELRGFGAFSAKLRAAHTGRNPRTGVAVQVAKKAVPFFKTGKEMRARLNRETLPSD